MRTGVLIITILDHNSNSFLDSLDSLQKYTKSMSYWQLRLSDKQKNFNIIIENVHLSVDIYRHIFLRV